MKVFDYEISSYDVILMFGFVYILYNSWLLQLTNRFYEYYKFIITKFNKHTTKI